MSNNIYPDMAKALLRSLASLFSVPTFNRHRGIEPCASCQFGPNYMAACGGGVACRKKGRPAGAVKMWDKGPDGYAIEVGWHVPVERAAAFAKGLRNE